MIYLYIYIYLDLLANNKPAFAKVIADVPDHLSVVFSSSPAAVALVLSSSDTLGSVLEHCPQVRLLYIYIYIYIYKLFIF